MKTLASIAAALTLASPATHAQWGAQPEIAKTATADIDDIWELRQAVDLCGEISDKLGPSLTLANFNLPVILAAEQPAWMLHSPRFFVAESGNLFFVIPGHLPRRWVQGLPYTPSIIEEVPIPALFGGDAPFTFESQSQGLLAYAIQRIAEAKVDRILSNFSDPSASLLSLGLAYDH